VFAAVAPAASAGTFACLSERKKMTKYRKNSVQHRQATIAARSRPSGPPSSPTVNYAHEQLDYDAKYEQGLEDAMDLFSILLGDLLTDIQNLFEEVADTIETDEMEIDAGKDE
jgi:hypothetical protein